MTGAVIAALAIGVVLGAAVMWFALRGQAAGPGAVPLGEIKNQLTFTAGQVQQIAMVFAGAQQRGRAAEITLENLLEAAGMGRHRDYETQVTAADGSRPDVVLNLAGRGRLVLDAKFPLDDYRRAAGAADPGQRKAALAAHARAVAAHISELAARDYPSKVGDAIDFTVCYVPGEDLLAAAYEANPGLFQEAISRRVLLATPAGLLAMLWSIAWGWQRDARVAGAEQVGKAGAELHKRLGVMAEHLERLRRALSSAVEAYDDTVGSLERRVLPQARRFEDLGILAPGTHLPELGDVGRSPRPVTPSRYPDADTSAVITASDMHGAEESWQGEEDDDSYEISAS